MPYFKNLKRFIIVEGKKIFFSKKIYYLKSYINFFRNIL